MWTSNNLISLYKHILHHYPKTKKRGISRLGLRDLGPLAGSPIRQSYSQSNLIGSLMRGLMFPRLQDTFRKLIKQRIRL